MAEDPTPYRGIRRERTRDALGMFAGDHRCTPPVIWRAALHAIGATEFDLDAATNARASVPCRLAYDGSTPELNGLVQPWEGNTWLNFPFSQPTPWVDKAIREFCRCRSVTILGPFDPSTDWNQLIVRAVDAYATWPRREHFPVPGQPKGSPPGAIALFYTGPQSNAWLRIMRDDYGCTVYPGRTDGDRPIVLTPPKRPRSLWRAYSSR